MTTNGQEQLTLWELGPQQLTVTFDGGCLVTDSGLLALRALDKELGVLAERARRFPDPRAQTFVTHSREAILTQQVYQILAGYADGKDAQQLRHDPLFQTIADVSPASEQPLASSSTLARFQQAFTRRQADLPLEARPVLREVDAAQTQRLKIRNDYLPELFIRTRRRPPASILIDLDPSDDPTHGQQVLEINRLGTNQRFVVTKLSGHPQGIYPGFSVQRGQVPEKPIGELKNGLQADRLSFHRFRANALKLLEPTLAYA